MQTLLIVEDDTGIAAGLEYSLTQEGYGIVLCTESRGGGMVRLLAAVNLRC